MNLFAELGRRHVYRTGIAYIVASWLLVQVADILFDAFGVPDGAMRGVIIVLAIGLPLVLVGAWVFEWTPEGLVRDPGPEQTLPSTSGKRLNQVIVTLLALAVLYLLMDKFLLQDRGEGLSSVEAIGDKSASTARSGSAADPTPSIAVIPFTNRSRLEDDAFFVEGIHDDLLTSLARIGALKVISRTSVLEYENTTKKIPVIAGELGVSHVLEGAVQRSGDTVRINVQLIDAATDEHVWAQIYDRDLTAENLFAIQSEISRAIAEALQAELSPDEAERLDARPTDNLAAYDLYLEAKQRLADLKTDELATAERQFRQALELDPEFALAWIGLARAIRLNSTAALGSRPLVEAGAEASEATERALAIDPNLGEAWLAKASDHFFNERLGLAEDAYRKAIELIPGSAEAWRSYAGFLGAVPARAREAEDAARRAHELDPRSRSATVALAMALQLRGLLAEAEVHARRLVELHPDYSQGYRLMLRNRAFFLGDVSQGLAWAEQMAAVDDASPFTGVRELFWLELGELDRVRRQDGLFPQLQEGDWRRPWGDALVALKEDAPESYVHAMDRAKAMGENFPHEFAVFPIAHGLRFRDADWTMDALRRLAPAWLEPDHWEAQVPHSPQHACLAAWIFLEAGEAELGRSLLTRATAEHRRVAEAVEHPGWYSPQHCHLLSGDHEAALDAIERQVAQGNDWQLDVLVRLPLYDPIRDEPRFHAAMAKREARIARERDEALALFPEET